MALDLLNATDRFLGEARAISAERRKAQLERALQQEVAALFLRQGDMFLRKFAKLREVWPVQEAATFAPPYTPPSWEAFWRDVSDATKDPFENALNKVIEIAMTIGGESLANAGMGVAFDLRHPYAERYLWEHGAVNVSNINKTTEDYIRTVVAHGAEEGWSYDRVARAISDRFEEFAVGKPQQHIDSRAHLVAVTEVGMAYEAGNRTVANSLSEMGLQMEKSWLTAGDNRVCSEECELNQNAAPENSGWIPIDEPFPSGHQQPLAHPACRCAALYRRRPGPGVRAAAGPVTVLSNPNDIVNAMADQYEKRWGWDATHTREDFIRRNAERYNALAADSQSAESFRRAVEQVANDYGIEPLTTIVTKAGAGEEYIAAEYSSGTKTIRFVTHQGVPKSQPGVSILESVANVHEHYDDANVGTYIHEYGHYISDTNSQFRSRLGEVDLDDSATKSWVKQNISWYAASKNEELGAEVYALYKHKNFTSLSADVKQFVLRIVEGT